MFKKILALLMVVMLLPITAAHANETSARSPVDEAMDAYAQKILRPYQNQFSLMTREDALAFRTAVDKVYGRDNHDDDKSKLMSALTTLGFTVTEDDGIWRTDKSQVSLNLRYLILLAQMDMMPFEDAVAQVNTWLPDYDLGQAAFSVATDIFVNLVGSKLTEMVKADSIVFSMDFIDAGRQLQKGKVFSRTLGKAVEYTGRHFADIYQTATTATEAAKSLTGYLNNDPALLNLANSVNQALSGASYLEAMFAGGVHDQHLSNACQMLSSAYQAFLTEMDELGQHFDAHSKLQDEEYLSSRFEAILQQKLEGYLTGKDALEGAVAGALTIGDVIWNGGWGQIIVKGGVNVLGEAALGTASTYSHFHAMAVLDEIYAAMADGASGSLSAWEDYAAYARSIQRLCNIALLGESHIYQLTTEDAGAGQKLWNLLKYEFTGEDLLARNTQWYNQRVEYLHGVYNAAQDYLTALYAHHDELLAESRNINGLLGAEKQLTVTMAGEITQDKYFALPDGSGPDYSNPNPGADKPIEDITVSLVTLENGEEKIIASASTNADGRYTLTYPVLAVQDMPLTLKIGKQDSDDYVVKENVSALNVRSTDFRSSFRWNPDLEYLSDLDAANAVFPLPFANDLFLGAPSSYDHNLALASLGLSAAAMSDPAADFAWTSRTAANRDANICAAWNALDFHVAASGGYDQSLNRLPDAPGYTIAVKTFEDPDDLDAAHLPQQYRVVGVAIRGDVDMAELVHTVMAAGGNNENIRSAAAAILPDLADVILSGYREDVPTKVWITGFSRGGAIAAQLSSLLNARADLSSKVSGQYLYTFGAPGVSTSNGFNLVYEEDLVAQGLLKGTRGRWLTFGAAQASKGRNRIASAFHHLTFGNSAYDPGNFVAASPLNTAAQALPAKELQPILTAVMQMSFLRSAAGDDFRTLSLQEKHALSLDVVGENVIVLNSADRTGDSLSSSAIEDILSRVISGTSRTFFSAMPTDMQENLTAYLGDVLRLAAYHSGKGADFQLSDALTPHFLSLVLTLSDDFSAPTALYSSLYAHHPEVYMAWLLGLNGKELLNEDVCVKFSTSVLPWDKNLFGTVVDAESKKPLAGVPVHIEGGYGEDAVDRILYTDEKGKWDTFVKPADYTVTFELPGYETKVEQVYAYQFSIDRVELLTELAALAHDSIVITTTTRYEEGDYYRVEIVHPYVYSTKNPELYSIVERAIGPSFDKLNAEVSKYAASSHTGCTWDLRYHEEDWLYMATAYATDDVLSLTIHSGGFYCGFGHNFNTRTSYTFDIATGKNLTLDDLLDPANPNAKKDFQAQITQALKEKEGSFDLSEHYSASQVYKSANQKKTVYDWYMLNDGIEMLVPALAGNGQYGIFIPYTRLEGIVKPGYLPAENIGSAQVKAVRRENLLDDYSGQQIYNDNGTSNTGVQLDGLATHVWIDERTSAPVASCGKYFYGYKVKDLTFMMPPYEGSVGVAWTDWQGDHFSPITVLPEPEPEPVAEDDGYLP